MRPEVKAKVEKQIMLHDRKHFIFMLPDGTANEATATEAITKKELELSAFFPHLSLRMISVRLSPSDFRIMRILLPITFRGLSQSGQNGHSLLLT